MSSETVISMRELEAESVELLPSRETLCAPRCGGHGYGSSYSYSSTSQSFDGNGILNILNGSNVNVLVL